MFALVRSNSFQGLQRIAAGFAMSIICSACSIQTTVVIGNVSIRVAVISYKDDSHKIAELVLKPGTTQEIKHLLDVHFTIRTPESIANYERAVVPESFVQNTGFGPFFRRTVMVQLENDKCIYLLKADIVRSAGHPVQPPGFPLCPAASQNGAGGSPGKSTN